MDIKIVYNKKGQAELEFAPNLKYLNIALDWALAQDIPNKEKK